MLLAVFLMLLFPAVSLHVQARESAFRILLAEWKESRELIQRQGGLTASVIERFARLEQEGFEEIKLEIKRRRTDGSVEIIDRECLLTEGTKRLGELAYPLETKEMLEVRICMPFDFLERIYYTFCPMKAEGRSFVDYVVVRDGIANREAGQIAEDVW